MSSMYSSSGSITDRNGDARISRRIPSPARPVVADLLGRVGIDVDVDGADVVGERARVLERLDDGAVDAADRDDDRVVLLVGNRRGP